MRRPSSSCVSALSFAALALCIAGCPKKDAASGEEEAQLLSKVKTALAERERKLSSYHLEGTVSEAGQQARFDFDYRAPVRMKGTVRSEGERTWSFDGDRVFELSPADKSLVTYELKLPPEKSALWLTELFSRFAPEGFRAPVMGLDKAKAKQVPHARGPEAVEVTSTTKDEAGGAIVVTYLYRLPAMDLLEKRMTANGATMTLAVEEEQCDAKLKLCVPKKLVQRFGAEEGAVTTLSVIDLNAAVPNDAFTLSLPEGFTATTRQLVETAP